MLRWRESHSCGRTADDEPFGKISEIPNRGVIDSSTYRIYISVKHEGIVRLLGVPEEGVLVGTFESTTFESRKY